MNASKEEARNALEILEELKSANLGEPNKSPGWVGQALGEIEAFLLSAERKLPSEKSYEREKQRKRTKKGDAPGNPDNNFGYGPNEM